MYATQVFYQRAAVPKRDKIFERYSAGNYCRNTEQNLGKYWLSQVHILETIKISKKENELKQKGA